MKHLIYLSLFFSASLFAGDIIHKWVDEDGNIYYGDAPPISTTTKEVRVIGAPSNPGRALPRLSDTDSDDKPANSDVAGSEELPKDQAAVACERAQEDLRVIDGSSRVKLRAADGSTRYMTTEEIEERRKSSEEDIAKFCQ